MSQSRLVSLVFLLALAACDTSDPAEGSRHLERLCDPRPLCEAYLDFYWDDLRTHQSQLWSAALATCMETCPDAVNCGPVRSVASWYEELASSPPVASQPRNVH